MKQLQIDVAKKIVVFLVSEAMFEVGPKLEITGQRVMMFGVLFYRHGWVNGRLLAAGYN